MTGQTYMAPIFDRDEVETSNLRYLIFINTFKKK